ncbi:hypothetical protein GF415_01475 [Candidatus Micrarchaeota archaeon]|nr:hypothetical protein [Candidatus Micrarchaeota archaeon]
MIEFLIAFFALFPIPASVRLGFHLPLARPHILFLVLFTFFSVAAALVFPLPVVVLAPAAFLWCFLALSIAECLFRVAPRVVSAAFLFLLFLGQATFSIPLYESMETESFRELAWPLGLAAIFLIWGFFELWKKSGGRFSGPGTQSR